MILGLSSAFRMYSCPCPLHSRVHSLSFSHFNRFKNKSFDLEKYFFGCKTLENMVVHPHGSASRRPGTRYVSEIKDSSAVTRLIPFEFSTTQTYM